MVVQTYIPDTAKPLSIGGYARNELADNFAAALGLRPRKINDYTSMMAQGKGQVVITPHGFLTLSHFMSPICDTLEKHGFRPEKVPMGGLNFGYSMREFLYRQAMEHVERGEDINFAGWSMGGILSRIVALQVHEKCPGAVKTVTTLGSPIAAAVRESTSPAAAIFEFFNKNDPMVFDRKTREDFMAPLPEGINETFISAGNDCLLEKALCVPKIGNAQRVELPGVGHYGLVRDGRVPALISNAVAYPGQTPSEAFLKRLGVSNDVSPPQQSFIWADTLTMAPAE